MSRGWCLEEETEVPEAPRHKSETKALSIGLWTVPPGQVVVRVLHPETRQAVQGADVIMAPKVIPVGRAAPKVSKVTDSYGDAYFKGAEELAVAALTDPNAVKWLIMADIPASEFGYVKDEVSISISAELGQLITITLKHYREVPTLYLRFELKDVVGVELWSSWLASVQAEALKRAGYALVSVEGSGARVVTIKFKPPWTASSPWAFTITISWTFVAAIILIALAIIAVLVVLRWTFGEWTPAVVGGLILLLLIPALAAIVPKKEEKEGGKR